jgi:ComF family protein
MFASDIRGSKGSMVRALGATARLVLDAVFPWRCTGCGREGRSIVCDRCTDRVRWIEEPVCPACGLPLASGPPHLCHACIERPPAFRRARAIACYRAHDEGEDPLGIALRGLKYAGRRALARPLAELVADRFPFAPDEFDLVVPVPLHPSRLRSRGFNQALLLARAACRRWAIPVEPRALVRVRPTPPQVGLGEAERRRNLRGALAVRPGADVRGRRVLVIDDVATTLATANESAKALLRGGARAVDVLTLARTLVR